MRVTSGFGSEVGESCDLLCYYEASSGNLLPTFWDNLSVPIFKLLTPEMGPIGCLETSVRNCHSSLRNDPEERSSQI